MTLDMKWVVEFSLCSPAPLRCGGDYAAGVVWEEIIKLQTLKMRLLLWPRQSSLFLLTAALCSLIAIIEAIIASRKMTFPLVLRRGRASFCCILSLSVSAAALYDASHHVFIHGRDGKDVCEYPGKSSTLLYTQRCHIPTGWSSRGHKALHWRALFTDNSLTCHKMCKQSNGSYSTPSIEISGWLMTTLNM